MEGDEEKVEVGSSNARGSKSVVEQRKNQRRNNEKEEKAAPVDEAKVKEFIAQAEKKIESWNCG